MRTTCVPVRVVGRGSNDGGAIASDSRSPQAVSRYKASGIERTGAREQLLTTRLQICEAPGIRVIFDPTVRAYNGNCVPGRSAVFDVGRKRRIKPEPADPGAVAAQVARRPPGALQYELPEETHT